MPFLTMSALVKKIWKTDTQYLHMFCVLNRTVKQLFDFWMKSSESILPLGEWEINSHIRSRRDNVELGIKYINPMNNSVKSRESEGSVALVLSNSVLAEKSGKHKSNPIRPFVQGKKSKAYHYKDIQLRGLRVLATSKGTVFCLTLDTCYFQGDCFLLNSGTCNLQGDCFLLDSQNNIIMHT